MTLHSLPNLNTADESPPYSSASLLWVPVSERVPETPDSGYEASYDVVAAQFDYSGALLRWERLCMCADHKRWARDGIVFTRWTPTHWAPVPALESASDARTERTTPISPPPVATSASIEQALNAARYHRVRQLNAREFAEIFKQNIETDVPFDTLIDRLLLD